MKKIPELSIILPVYNRQAYVKKAIKSVLGQSYKDYELIIIDDGSTDNSAKIIKQFDDPRIRYYWQKNRGEYPTMNRGFKLVRGKYVAIMHSDDMLVPMSLKRRVDCLNKNPKIDIAHGDMVKVDENNIKTGLFKAADDTNGKIILKEYCRDENERSEDGYYIHYPTFMFRRDVIKKVGNLDESIRYAGDLDWIMRAMLKCKFKRVPYVVYRYRRHNETITRVVKREGMPTYKITQTIQARYCPIK